MAIKQCLHFRHAVLVYLDWLYLRDVGEFGVKRMRLIDSLSLPDPSRVFWTSSTSLRVVRKEGEDYLLPCLLTDPAATDLGLRMDNGTSVPPGMNFTVYRHRGILIHSLHPSFNADYVCTARVDGVEKTSKAFSINVIQSEELSPKAVIGNLN